MADPSFAAYANALSVKSYEEYLKCDIIAVPQKYFPFQMGYTIQKNSSFFDVFSFYINQMKESGVVDRLKMLHEEKPQVCPNLEGKPLHLRQCISTLCIIALGMGLSFICLRYTGY
jgi:hypothetical protein